METTTTLATAITVPKWITRHVPRILLGLCFFVFGLNGFFNFIPPPTKAMPDDLLAFFNGIMKSGYLFQLLKGTEVAVGVLLLINRFVPLALVLIAPVVVNIVAVHLFLDRSGLPVALVVLACELYLAWAHRKAYRPLLASRQGEADQAIR